MPQLSLHTPVGDLTISEEDGAIVALDWGWGRDQTETPLLLRARDQLHEYFDEVRLAFDIAASAGGSARSVGTANSRNPIPIIIPGHRVVAGNGIGGYSGGDGLPTKHYLLDLELRAATALAAPGTKTRLL